ncbi:hypothetical protein GBS25_23190 [Escherichia coli]|nr:hypothetical protein [Escherichia coli]
MFAGKKSAQIREILISESAWEEMTCLFAPSLELQAQNWQKNGQHQAISSQQLAHWMSLLQLNGVKNYGYYPDNFLHNQPEIDLIRPEFSTAWYPKND